MPGKVHRLHCEVSICIVPAVGIEGADRCGGSQEVDVGTLLRSMWTSMDSHEPFNSTSHTGGGGDWFLSVTLHPTSHSRAELEGNHSPMT